MFQKWLLLLVTLPLCLGNLGAQDRISPLSAPPDWSRLEAYQETISREDFAEALTTFYSIGDSYKHTIKLHEDHAQIQTGEDQWMKLKFRQDDSVKKAPGLKRYWRSMKALRPGLTESQPLKGVRIALDPGHLGGPWARMEERWYTMDDGGKPVTEGDLTLQVAKLLQPRLEKLGATVLSVRTSTEPTTKRRPKDFVAIARADLKRMGIEDPDLTYPPDALPGVRRKTVQWHSEKYFYRLSEIRERANLVNTKLKPDLTLCLHFNAEGWGDPSEPAFVPRNHLHFLINGAYSVYELGLHDERLQMLLRLLQRTHDTELLLAEGVAPSVARHTQLPAFNYLTNNVKRPSKNPYVYARNLLANRLFECPVLYFEPYVMNCEDVYARVQAGFYEGEREVNGFKRISIFHEYVEGTVEGLVTYFTEMKGSTSE